MEGEIAAIPVHQTLDAWTHDHSSVFFSPFIATAILLFLPSYKKIKTVNMIYIAFYYVLARWYIKILHSLIDGLHLNFEHFVYYASY